MRQGFFIADYCLPYLNLMRVFERLAQWEKNLMIDVAGKRSRLIRIKSKAVCQRRGKIPRRQESQNHKPGLLCRKSGFFHRKPVFFADFKHFLRDLRAENSVLQRIREFLVLRFKLLFGVLWHIAFRVSL